MATVTKGKTFGVNDSVANTDLHTLVDNATVSAIAQADLGDDIGLVTRSTTAPSDTDSLWYDTTNTVLKVYNGSSWVQVGAPAKSISGLALSNGTDATNDIDITTGSAMDATDALLMTLSSAFTKQLDATFAEGTAAGGRASADNLTGAKWFYVWLIGDTTSAKSPDVFMSTSASPTLPTGWDVKRRIGGVKWDGSAMELFYWSGNGNDCRVYWDTPIASDLTNDETPSTSDAQVDLTDGAPVWATEVLIHYEFGDANAQTADLYLKPNGGADSTITFSIHGSASDGVFEEGQVWMPCDSSQLIEYKATSGDGGSGAGYTIETKGYVDSR